MRPPIETQLEEMRQALPTPPGTNVRTGRYLFRIVGLYIALVAFFVLMFHVFNRQQEPRDSSDSSSAIPDAGR
jgi:hypothetical protein